MTAAVRSFGNPTARTVERIPIDFHYVRDDEPDTLRLRVLAKDLDVAAANQVLRLIGDSDEEQNAKNALPGMVRFVAKYMDDKDGVSARWAPTPLPVLDSNDGAEPVVNFRGPDGNIYPMSQATQFTTPDAGSSRRRWLYLMNEDDEAEVDQKALVDLIQFITEGAAKRPTPASS